MAQIDQLFIVIFTTTTIEKMIKAISQLCDFAMESQRELTKTERISLKTKDTRDECHDPLSLLQF